jgi:hypothetical protein
MRRSRVHRRRAVAELARSVVPLAVLALSALLVACNRSPTTPTEGEIITGAERFGWDQPAADAGELATFRYAFYVDDTRTEAADVSCAPPQAGRFPCTAQLPAMTTGSHAIQMASFVVDAGVVRESPRSATVRVIRR